MFTDIHQDLESQKISYKTFREAIIEMNLKTVRIYNSSHTYIHTCIDACMYECKSVLRILQKKQCNKYSKLSIDCTIFFIVLTTSLLKYDDNFYYN